METWMYPGYRRIEKSWVSWQYKEFGERLWCWREVLRFRRRDYNLEIPSQRTKLHLTSPGKAVIGEDIVSYWREMTKGHLEIGRLRSRRRTGEGVTRIQTMTRARSAVCVSEIETHVHSGGCSDFCPIGVSIHSLGLFLATPTLASKQKW